MKSNPSELIGMIDLWRSPAPRENRGFWLSQKYWGHGYMLEALVPVTDHAFIDLHFTEIRLSNAFGNVRSRRIKEKQGATFLGVEDFDFVDPAYKQLERWVLIKENWKKS